MNILLYTDSRSWLQLPDSFPTAQGELPREWENRVIDAMREVWTDGMDNAAEQTQREALRHGLSRVRPEDAITLQYWPTASVVNAIVHVAGREFGPGEQRAGVPLDDTVQYVTAPALSTFEANGLGSGVEARYLIPAGANNEFVLGGVNYLFENERGAVLVSVEPTLPKLIGLMLEPLREVVRSIRVTEDGDTDSAAWDRATVDDAVVAPYGDTWNIGAAADSQERREGIHTSHGQPSPAREAQSR
jgi:hypothetical protein